MEVVQEATFSINELIPKEGLQHVGLKGCQLILVQRVEIRLFDDDLAQESRKIVSPISRLDEDIQNAGSDETDTRDIQELDTSPNKSRLCDRMGGIKVKGLKV